MNLLSTTRALLGKADSYRRKCRDTDRFKTCRRDKRFKLSTLYTPPQTSHQRFVHSEPDRTYDTERFDDKSLRTLLQQQTRTTHINSTDDLIRRQHTFTIQQAVDQHKEGILGQKAESRQKELHNRTAERMVGSLASSTCSRPIGTSSTCSRPRGLGGCGEFDISSKAECIRDLH